MLMRRTIQTLAIGGMALLLAGLGVLSAQAARPSG
jgi:hypothetical protein